jgi:asparagine synthase (glutamine-hydrolysing)
MIGTLKHRGPDGQGVHLSRGAGIAHTRLSIIDLATGAQPMTNEDGSLWVTFNGEIYNYRELRPGLESAGHTFRTQSDTECLLHLYEQEGPEMVQKLNGMFAFALWNEKDRTLFCARDRFGIKPFYYVQHQDVFAFASEIKALLALPFVKAEPDPISINEYLTFQFCLGTRTLFKGIQKLEPGHTLTLRGNSVEIRPYWDISHPVDTHHTEDYFVDHLRELLQDSVRLQLRSDVPLGCYLSGGLDSSTVTSLAARQYPDRLQTFTGAFHEAPQYDESVYAEGLAKDVGAISHVSYIGHDDFLTHLRKILYHLDEPVGGPGSYPQYFVSKKAREHVTVCLGGQGGDEMFGGYARYLLAYLEQCIKGAIQETREEGRHIVSLESITPHLHLLKDYVPLLKNFLSEGVFDSMDARYFRLIDRSPELGKIYSRDLLAVRNNHSIFETFASIFNRPDTLSYFNKMTYFDLKTLLPALLQIEDRVSMAASLESRVPLLDHRIAELVASAPPPIKFRGGHAKHLLRTAVAPFLPALIRDRKDKRGFPVPTSEWFGGPLREQLTELLLDRRAQSRGLYRREGIEALLKGESRYGRQLWGLLNIELWFQEFIDP